MFSFHIQVCDHVFRFSSQVWVFIFRYLCSGVQVQWSVFRVGYSGVGIQVWVYYVQVLHLGIEVQYSGVGIQVWVLVFRFGY